LAAKGARFHGTTDIEFTCRHSVLTPLEPRSRCLIWGIPAPSDWSHQAFCHSGPDGLRVLHSTYLALLCTKSVALLKLSVRPIPMNEPIRTIHDTDSQARGSCSPCPYSVRQSYLAPSCLRCVFQVAGTTSKLYRSFQWQLNLYDFRRIIGVHVCVSLSTGSDLALWSQQFLHLRAEPDYRPRLSKAIQ
jgi:hypothetical protein